MTKSQQAVIAARKEVKLLWSLMCAFDGVPVGENFVHFSEGNPYSVGYNNAVSVFYQAKKLEKVNSSRRERHRMMLDCGLVRVKGALGGTYYE